MAVGAGVGSLPGLGAWPGPGSVHGRGWGHQCSVHGQGTGDRVRGRGSGLGAQPGLGIWPAGVGLVYNRDSVHNRARCVAGGPGSVHGRAGGGGLGARRAHRDPAGGTPGSVPGPAWGNTPNCSGARCRCRAGRFGLAPLPGAGSWRGRGLGEESRRGGGGSRTPGPPGWRYRCRDSPAGAPAGGSMVSSLAPPP